jgi:hypothetical protein
MKLDLPSVVLLVVWLRWSRGVVVRVRIRGRLAVAAVRMWIWHRLAVPGMRVMAGLARYDAVVFLPGAVRCGGCGGACRWHVCRLIAGFRYGGARVGGVGGRRGLVAALRYGRRQNAGQNAGQQQLWSGKGRHGSSFGEMQ